ECPNRTFKNSWYIISVDGWSWPRNRETCQSQGGDLVSMETEEEWNFMNDAIQRGNTKSFENKWSIGLTKEKKGGNWTWVHGRPLTICKWGQGEPSGEHDAAFIYKRSRNGERGVFGIGRTIWKNYDAYICEISKGKSSFLLLLLLLPCHKTIGKRGKLITTEISPFLKIDLVAVISGGAEVTRGLHRNITLNASLSYDPEVAHANQPRIMVKSQEFPSANKRRRRQTKISLRQYTSQPFTSGEQISLNTKAMSVNQTYIVKLVVTKDIRISTVYQVIHLIEGDPPEIYQRLEIYFCSKISSYKWVLYQQFKRNTSFTWQRKHNLRLITSTPLNSSDIVIKGGSLAGGNKYRLALFVTITDGLRGMNAYEFSTAIPPTGGNCSITPPSGISLKTDFRLSCSHWKSENNPLSYQFQYRLKNDLYNVLYRGVNNNIKTSWIPPGNNAYNFVVKVIATVTDNFGISASPVSSTVQIKPYQNVSTDFITNLLLAKDSLFRKSIEIRNLREAALIANSVMLSVSQETSMNLQERYKVMNYILEKVSPLGAKTVSDLLHKSSAIGSALQVLEKVPHQSLNISLFAISSMTSLLWSIAQEQLVADTPLTTQSAENLASCLNSVLKAAAVTASEDSKSSFQQQGVSKSSHQTDSSKLIYTCKHNIILTLFKNGIPQIAVNFTVIPVIQILDLVVFASDVVTLKLKNNKRELIKVSNLSEDIVIVTPLKPDENFTKIKNYFTRDDNLLFHVIEVRFENTWLMLEIKPQDPTVYMFVYMRFGQRPTTQDYDLNATISHGEKCVWVLSAHDKSEGQTVCSLNPHEPIQFLAERPGKYFLGLKHYNATVNLSHKRGKRSCFGGRRRKRSCVEVKDAPPTPPQSENVFVMPVYDSTRDQNYTLKVALGSCVYW
ncbi:unnamed protein product, partial [Pocillopora meandrina]